MTKLDGTQSGGTKSGGTSPPNPAAPAKLTAWLLRRTPPRPLLLTTPGGTRARLAAERVVRERGWPAADSPAEANMLVIAGPLTDQLRPYLTAVWAQVPAPRVRVHLDPAASEAVAAEAELAASADALRVTNRQRQGGSGEGFAVDVPMADRFPDRDGLMLDQLRLPLGPALAHWPAGLAVLADMQGDVVQDAAVEPLGLDGVAGEPFWAARPPAARALDSCTRLLTVAGWADAAARARGLRDDILRGARDERALSRWARRVRRSRILRWSLAGIGGTDNADPPTRLRGDALGRLHRWIDDALDPAPEPAGPSEPDDSAGWSLRAIPELLRGSELAAARIIIASLDPDPEALARTGASGG